MVFRRFMIVFLLLMSSVFLMACEEQISPNLSNGTGDITTTEEIYDAIFPDYIVDGQCDESLFIYAVVSIHLLDGGAEKSVYLNDSGLSDGNYDDVFLSTYTNLITLTYKSKRDLFDDFSLIQNVYNNGGIERPIISLNTVQLTFEITESNTVDDLIDVTDQYFGTEVIYNDIEYILVDEIGLEMLPTKAYESLDEYLTDYPDNDFEFVEMDFQSHILLVISFGHSSSRMIEGLSLFYIDETTLEAAIISTANSLTMTEDYRPYTYVVFISKDDYRDSSEIIIHFHTKFMNGSYADRPFHNSIDG